MSIDLNGSNIDTENIVDVRLDLKRNITVVLEDDSKIIIRRSDRWKEKYKELTGYCTND